MLFLGLRIRICKNDDAYYGLYKDGNVITLCLLPPFELVVEVI